MSRDARIGTDSSVAARSPRTLVLAAGALVLSVAALLAVTDKLSALRSLGVPTMDPPFADLRTITGAGEALRLGLDPRVENPGDPWGRPFNYMGVWLAPARLGLGPDATVALAIAMWSAFGVGIAALARAVNDRRAALVVVLGILSPATWFALERANNDLLVFGLLGVTALVCARRPVVGAFLLGAAAVLKLFPVFAAPALWSSGRRGARPATIALLVAFSIGCAATWKELVAIRAATQFWPPISYGIGILPRLVSDNSSLSRELCLGVAYGLALLTALGCWAARDRLVLGASHSLTKLSVFRVGAGVYIGTYLLGSNFDYRLLFLLFAAPQLVEWRSTGDRRVRALATTVTVGILLMLWRLAWRNALSGSSLGRVLGDAADEVLCATVWVGLLAALVSSSRAPELSTLPRS